MCQSREEAAYHEVIYSLRYGIPTLVFKEQGRRVLNGVARRVFDALDTRIGALRLLDDLGIAYDYPHYLPKASNRDRRNFSTTMCAEYRSSRSWMPSHRYTISGSDEEDARRLAGAGLPIRSAKKHHGGWRIEGTSRDLGMIAKLRVQVEKVLGGITHVEKARLVAGRALALTAAGNCHPGMLMYVANAEGKVELDEIVSVDRVRYTGKVFDLNVERTHNYIANGIVTHNCIYGWRGAVNAFDQVDYPILPLTSSWRFGSEIASPANDVLEALGETILIRGRGPRGQVVVNDTARPNAIVARTNAGLIGEAIRVVDEGASVHVVGGHEQIFAWLMAAWELFRWNRTRHPAFAMFASWSVLKTASEQPIGRIYKPFVTLVEQYRNDVPGILRRLEGSCAPDDLADVSLSSVHRYKGQEAEEVRMADDFGLFCYPNTKPGATEPYIIDEEEANLAYVALTRARKVLDLGGYAGTLRQSLSNARALRNPAAPRSRSLR